MIEGLKWSPYKTCILFIFLGLMRGWGLPSAPTSRSCAIKAPRVVTLVVEAAVQWYRKRARQVPSSVLLWAYGEHNQQLHDAVG